MALLTIKSEITGTVWKIAAQVGETVAADADIIILESMKMEIPVSVPSAGVITQILVQEGDVVQEGQILAVLEA